MSARPNTVAIASGKGGVGKSFLALNLALALAELGERVLLVELDADAGALSIAAGLGDVKAPAPIASANEARTRAVTLQTQPRLSLLRASDLPPAALRSPSVLEPLLSEIPVTWRIVDLAPGLAAANILWLRRAKPAILIGTPELVCVHAMLRVHVQLRRQHAYERLCTLEPRLRHGPASLSHARQRLLEMHPPDQAGRLWQRAYQEFRSPLWIFNRVLNDDAAQLARIASYLHRQASTDSSALRTIPEDPAQLRCARFGRPLLTSTPNSPAAVAIGKLAEEMVAREQGAAHRVACKV